MTEHAPKIAGVALKGSSIARGSTRRSWAARTKPYRFARGEMIVGSSGVRAGLQLPLDFLVVADHAKNLGLAP